MLPQEQLKIEEMYNELCALRNFQADVHFSLKHLAHLEKDMKFYTERLNTKYADFKRLSQKHLGMTEEEACKIIENVIKDDI